MLRLPVKKIRKQFKLLLLLVLLTFAVWFTYLHISLVRQGKAIKLHFNYGKDGEKPNEGTDGGRNRDSRASSNHRKPGDSRDSREDEQGVNGPDQFGGRNGDESRDSIETSKFLSLKQNTLPWTPEYKGQANLHVFEDWCGSSINQLRKNLHFPLYPHTRTVVKKLAVAPKWKNYGLRIFGYIHPYRDGDFQFAVSSDDNSEFWLSSDENPINARLLVYVGKLGSEWTAPGEFTKFRSQVSKSVHLIFARRYYFEVLHKQDDKGSDHIEVGWRPFLPGLKFEVIDSAYISLYTEEASLKMNSVDHIPQTHASHAGPRHGASQTGQHGADMLKPDARDTFFLTPMIEPSHLENLLPACLYSPTYVVKDFPIARYQGLQFVYLSFVYPNDFTRLTHMETENKCFYRESPIYLEKFGFYKYMKMDEEEDDKPFFFPNPEDFPDEEEGVDPEDESLPTESHAIINETNASLSDPRLTSRVKGKPDPPTAIDYGDDVDDYAFRHRQKVFRAEETQDKETQRTNTKDPAAATDLHGNQEVVDFNEPIIIRGKSLSWIRIGPEELSKKGGDESVMPKHSMPSIFLTSRAKQIVSNSAHAAADTSNNNKDHKKDQNKTYITRPRPNRKTTLPRQPREVFPGVFLYQNGKTTKLVNLNTKLNGKGLVSASQLRTLFKDSQGPWLGSNITKEAVQGRKASARKWVSLHKKEVGKERGGQGKTSTPAPTSAIKEVPPPTTLTVKKPETDLNSSENTLPLEARVTSYMKTSEITETQLLEAEPVDEAEEGGLSDYSYEDSNPRPGWAEESINWQRTFTVNTMDFELLRSDWNDLRCNVSGNLQLSEAEVVDVLAQYMEKLNERNGGIYTLLRIINMEKRRDSARGNRYLIELELMERGRRVVRLSQYIYLLLHRSRHEDSLENSEGTPPSTTSTLPHTPPQWGTSYSKPLLCQPLGLQWRHNVMVHFVVPVKNQARWVQQFITDMEFLHQETKDDNFSVIIVDYESEDMNVEKALRDSKLPRYHYMRREGNFERSAGLQAGVDSVEDSHSIVFLCDLHIHFPLNIVESVRKHCVEGRLAYAPIVMRLACGSSPREPNGYWEVNGFGLFGIYKSDFDKIGGMNTEEFRDRWGGEDWELLDRVLQNGLEVERLRLRNFFHYYHSKRGMWNSKKPPKG
ncbi:N-acetyl-beta-glucosaminyl-glycoprotein 4-beta-N-acetylgalactosaminyltransferase 1-like [Acipenser ruthenus]|uniref:N-acetyl-beta-glucosaminyl-glycoprotein 4-beta-N-acetylgalactosaminyltransferase 1-like n=1 Tax=Acipenser ruthenus TaxID=7906 RepID=UPI002740B67C|nr:N-acetyl-beta-glucosaminyl-glycoprotein 4-beta-N-acetylgalactosaminyltransferase 1-like [Acipenser ruthenus]